MTVESLREQLRGTIALTVAMFVLALLPRVWTRHPFITWDELTWTYRSLKFLAAVGAGDWAGTFLTGHPGVVTMWGGAAALIARSPDPGWIAGLPPFDEDNIALMTQLAPWLPAAKVPVALLTAATVAGVFVLLRRLVDTRIALLAGLLLAFDPFYLAHSRVLHLDALMSGFMLLSVLSLLVYLTGQGSLVYVLLSGGLAGLAVLEKSPALFLVPFAGLAILAISLYRLGWRPVAIPMAVRVGAAWGAALIVVYVALWPALWVAPAGTLGQMWDQAVSSAGQPREAVFFLGETPPDPGSLFYPVVLAFRLTPVTVLGLVAAWLPLRRGSRQQRIAVLVLLVYVLLFTVFMGNSAKKFARYILPAAPALDVLAAAGWIALGSLFAGWLQRWHTGQEQTDRRWWWGGVALIALLQIALVLPYHPHYLAYYNPIFGNGGRAAQSIPVGWGEGMERAAQYLNSKPEATSLLVTTASIPLFAPFFVGQTQRLKPENLQQADYAVLYVDDVQIGEPALVRQTRAERIPERVIRLHGVDYAWIYRLRSP